MGNIRSSRSVRTDWLATGPLAPHIDAYKRYLIEAGYAAGTIACPVAALGHLPSALY
jgi:integrase/recombinase XerC